MRDISTLYREKHPFSRLLNILDPSSMDIASLVLNNLLETVRAGYALGSNLGSNRDYDKDFVLLHRIYEIGDFIDAIYNIDCYTMNYHEHSDPYKYYKKLSKVEESEKWRIENSITFQNDYETLGSFQILKSYYDDFYSKNEAYALYKNLRDCFDPSYLPESSSVFGDSLDYDDLYYDHNINLGSKYGNDFKGVGDILRLKCDSANLLYFKERGELQTNWRLGDYLNLEKLAIRDHREGVAEILNSGWYLDFEKAFGVIYIYEVHNGGWQTYYTYSFGEVSYNTASAEINWDKHPFYHIYKEFYEKAVYYRTL
jgi:hypothetical protein